MPKTTEPIVRFGELPPNPHARGYTRHWAIAAALRARPGAWAIIGTYANQTSATNNAGNCRRVIKAYQPAGSFEFTVRGCDVWARYVGGQS